MKGPNMADGMGRGMEETKYHPRVFSFSLPGAYLWWVMPYVFFSFFF